MSKLFMLNQAVDLNDFNDFKVGMKELVAIEKDEEHTFYKHNSIYNLSILSSLYSNFGYEEQEISRFIEQNLESTGSHIDTESKANAFCNSNYNAFLGIDFSLTVIPQIKCIRNDDLYKKWFVSNLSLFDRVKYELNNKCVYPNSFEKDFNALPTNAQESIIEKVIVCKDRKLTSPLAPGIQLIRDVTQPNFNFTVMELRISSPVALRIYFKEQKGVTYFASLEQKSNPNQSKDIKAAYDVLKTLLV